MTIETPLDKLKEYIIAEFADSFGSLTIELKVDRFKDFGFKTRYDMVKAMNEMQIHNDINVGIVMYGCTAWKITEKNRKG